MPANNGHNQKNGHKLDTQNNQADDPPFPGALDRGAAQPPRDEEKPVIFVDHEEHRVTAQSLSLLSLEDNIFKRSNILVRVSDPGEDEDELPRPPASPRIKELKGPKIRNILTRICTFAQWKRNSDSGEWEQKEIHPPEWLIPQILAHEDYPMIPKIEAVVECPVLRPDGSIITIPGHDARTGILYKPNNNYKFVEEQVSIEIARSAADEINELIYQFPFKSRTHKAVWLAALLTPFARFAIAGPCPIFLFDANAAGTGKSLLCDLISMIYCGRPMARMTYPDNDEEMRKKITSIGISGEPIMMLDNITHIFGGASIDSMATSVVWTDRRLGHNEMIECPLYTIWYVTGNNVMLKGDTHRRIIPCTLDCDEEKPHERVFEHEKILEYVKQRRPDYVKHCLTILRGYFQAGAPQLTRFKLGSFENWSDIIRSCVIWLTGEDCVEAQNHMRDNDHQSNIKVALINGLYELNGMRSSQGMTTSQIIAVLSSSPDSLYLTLKEALTTINQNSKRDPSSVLSYKLRSLKNSVVGGKKLIGVNNKDTGIMSWKIENISKDSQLSFSENSDEAFDD